MKERNWIILFDWVKIRKCFIENLRSNCRTSFKTGAIYDYWLKVFPFPLVPILSWCIYISQWFNKLCVVENEKFPEIMKVCAKGWESESFWRAMWNIYVEERKIIKIRILPNSCPEWIKFSTQFKIFYLPQKFSILGYFEI